MQEDVFARTGFRWLSDVEFVDVNEHGATVRLGPEWCRHLTEHYPDLFLNEAVMHLIEEDMQRKRATR